VPIEASWPWVFAREQTSGESPAVDAVVVAGVGSSALGTAALARNVANHLGRPVAGIVSGAGVADVLAEALGGWFVLGARNAARDAIARTLDALRAKDHVRDPGTHEAMLADFAWPGLLAERFVYGGPDSATLLYLLLELGARVRILVGHSKGNYSIENALEGWLLVGRRTGAPVPTDLRVVTLGAVIHFPAAFTNVHQFIGEVDAFGMMNSRLLVGGAHLVPGAWHSLNRAMPGHLAVAGALAVAGVR
jgi:hypothetical protein